MTNTPPPAPLQDVIAALAHNRELAQDEVTAAFDVVMRGDASPVQISALLTGLARPRRDVGRGCGGRERPPASDVETGTPEPR